MHWKISKLFNLYKLFISLYYNANTFSLVCLIKSITLATFSLECDAIVVLNYL